MGNTEVISLLELTESTNPRILKVGKIENQTGWDNGKSEKNEK